MLSWIESESTCCSDLASYVKSIRFFAAAVGHLVESSNHEPDMLITWHKVKFSLVTHDVDGFTDNDFEMAAKINALEQ